MNPLITTFVDGALALLEHPADTARSGELAAAIDTLDLSPANLGVALVFLAKYHANSVTSLDGAELDPLHYYTVIAALVLANKFINDQSYTLKTWQSILAKCLRFDAPLAMLNQLESHFLAALDYSLSAHLAADSLGMWAWLAARDGAVLQLRVAVEGPPAEGWATPTRQPVACALLPAYMALSYNSTPIAGPITPVLVPCVPVFPMFTLPGVVLTPLVWDWEQPAKRRRYDVVPMHKHLHI